MQIFPELLPDAPLWGRVILSSFLIYIYIILLTRIAGKRSVSKMNSFDWIVTVAVGSIVAAAVVSPDDFGPALISAGMLIGCQWGLTRISLHSSGVRKALKNNPTLLVRNGDIIQSGMTKTHVGETEIRAAARGAGLADMRQIKVMILETDGSFSVIPMAASDPEDFSHSTLKDLDEVNSLSDAGS